MSPLTRIYIVCPLVVKSQYDALDKIFADVNFVVCCLALFELKSFGHKKLGNFLSFIRSNPR